MHCNSGKCLDKSLMTDDTYKANSLVGTRIKAYIYFLVVSNLSIMGIEYAAVLPVPFLALAIMFFPAKAKGITSSYTGDGLSNPFSTILE